MAYCKKIVILNSVEILRQAQNDKRGVQPKAYLSLEQINKNLTGSVKFFNFEPESDLTLGLILNGVMLSSIVIKKEAARRAVESEFRFELNGKLGLNEEAIALIAKTENQKVQPLFFGGAGSNSEAPMQKLKQKIGEFN